MLVKILDKERVDTNATDDFTLFVITHGIDNVRHLLTMSKEDFNSMGCDIDFNAFRMLQTLNKMYNKDITEETDKANESLWFLGLKKCNVMRYMLCNKKVTMIFSLCQWFYTFCPLGTFEFKQGKVGNSSAIEPGYV